MNTRSDCEVDKADTEAPRAAYILTFCIGLIGANSLLLGPIAPDIARTFGVPVPTVMLAAALYGLGAALSSVCLAHHIDRLGPIRTLQVAIVGLALPLAACAMASHVAMMIVAQFLAGIASGVAVPAIYASAAAVAPPGREGKTVSVVLTGWMLSMVAGVSVSALLADLVNWRAVYSVIALLTLVSASLLLKLGRENLSRPGASSLALSALALPGIKPLLFSGTAFLTAFYGLYGYLGAYLLHQLEVPLGAIGLATLGYGLGFGCAVFFDRVIHQLGLERSTQIVLSFVALTYLLLAQFANSLGMVFILLAVLGLFNHLAMNLIIVRLTAIEPNKRGAIMGLNSAATNLAAFAGASGFGPVYEQYGFMAVALTAMVLAVLAIVTMTIRWPRLRVR